MSKINLTLHLRNISYGLLAMALVVVSLPLHASAAQITDRSVTIGSSAASAVTTYSFDFTVPSATVIQSASFTACTTASGSCTTPSGFSVTGTTLTAQPTNLGDATGWTVNTSTAGSLRLSKSGNSAAPTGAQTVGFSGVTNPSATNATFFIRMVTYSGATWTTPIDSGTVATSTAGQVTVTATVDETLTFTLASSTVALGTLSTSSTVSGTSSIAVATNAAGGYALTYSGNTLEADGGAIDIDPLTSGGASSIGAEQFGINVMDNATPNVGTAISGTGSGAAFTGYGTADSFKFTESGDTLATASAPTNSNTFTVSYIANIAGATPAGAYTTTLTYVATANF